MSSDHSISQWIHGVKAGDSTALQALWERYYEKLVHAARQRWTGRRRVADEEDVACSVFESFFRAARENRFPQLADRDQLWRLLLTMTARKTIDAGRRARSRGRGAELGESALGGSEGRSRLIAEVVGDEPAPEFVASLCEEVTHLLDRLEQDDLRAIAVAKLEGYTNAEIAEQHQCSMSTVERRLRLIRSKWRASASGE